MIGCVIAGLLFGGLCLLAVHIDRLHEAIDHGFDDFGAALERELHV